MKALAAAVAACRRITAPDRAPGLGVEPEPNRDLGLVEAVGLGVDLFDCVLPTRLARHGTALTASGRLHVRNAAYLRDDRPLDPTCGCAVCARWSRSYLRHLHLVGEPGGARLLTIHNLAWMFAFVGALRRSVLEGTFAARRAAVLATWAPAPSHHVSSTDVSTS